MSELLARKDAFNVGGFGQVMALEALRRREEFEALRDRLVETRESLALRLEELGFRVPRTDFVALLATHPDQAAELIQKELLKRGIAVRRFSVPEVADCIRITVAPPAQVELLLAALARSSTMADFPRPPCPSCMHATGLSASRISLSVHKSGPAFGHRPTTYAFGAIGHPQRIDRLLSQRIGPSGSLVVSGFWGSGTTWIHQALAGQLKAKRVHEPPHPLVRAAADET